MEFPKINLSEVISGLKKEQVSQALGITAATGVALYGIYAAFARRDKTPSGFREIPVPKGSLPYFGHLFSLGELPGVQMTQWGKDLNSPLIKIYMGVKTWVVVNDPYLAHELFVGKGAKTSGRPFQTFTHRYYSLNQRGVVFATDKSWKTARNAAIDVLTPKYISQFDPVLEREADEIIRYLHKATETNGSVAVFKPYQCASLNIILNTVLATRVSSPDDPLFKELIAIVDESMHLAGAKRDLSGFLPVLSTLDVIFRKETNMHNFIQDIRNPFFRKMIKDCMERGDDCLLKTMNALKASEQYVMDDDDILMMVIDMISAGSDTTAIVITWITIQLCTMPELQKRLCEEIDAFISEHKRVPKYSERENFPLLLSVQKECLRFRPPSHFGLLHEATEDVEIRGYYIRKGTVLVSNMLALHKSPEAFPDPDKFIAERYMNNLRPTSSLNNAKIDRRDHFNFGWGRRICPGTHLAEVEIFNLLVRLFATSTIEPPLDAEGKPRYPDLDNLRDDGLAIMPNDGAVRLVKRDNALISL